MKSIKLALFALALSSGGAALAMQETPSDPGTTSGSSSGGSHSGGTDVPAPPIALLFGVAAAGVMIGRRRKKD